MGRFPPVLLNRLWHSTTLSRYKQIIKSGAILPEPAIPDSRRWCAAQGPKYYPYVRTLGGVSLFDFTGFDPDRYSEDYPNSSWHRFVPLSKDGGGNKLWIEINRNLVKNSLIEGVDLIYNWKKNNAYCHNIMPLIEVAHIGAIDVSKFLAVYRFYNGSLKRLT